MGRLDRYVVGLDVGTTKVCAVIGARTADDGLEVLGVGLAPSGGQRKGLVVNIESTVEAIKSAVEEAELMAGVSVDAAFVGTSGGHIRGFNSRGMLTLEGKAREITEEDVRRVMDAARNLDLPNDREIIHLLPREFLVDGQDGILDPVGGMSASRLEVNVHLVVGGVVAVQNLVNCANRAGLEVRAVVLEQLASSEATLSDDERELGVGLVDIGGGTTDIACYHHRAVCHTAVLPTGGEHFTNDIAVGLRTPLLEAEHIKIRAGCVLPELTASDQTVEVPGIGGRGARLLPRRQLSEILRPRAVEVLDLVRDEIRKSGFADTLHAGIVLTGGGALLEGLPEAAEQRFGLPVRLGMPANVGGLVDVVSSPIYSTVVGLALYGLRDRGGHEHYELGDPAWYRRIGGRVARWVGELF